MNTTDIMATRMGFTYGENSFAKLILYRDGRKMAGAFGKSEDLTLRF